MSFPTFPERRSTKRMAVAGRATDDTAAITKNAMVKDRALTNSANHDPACTFVMTGREVPGFASLGSWLAYGLGSESNDLPAFVVLTPTWSAKAMAQALFTRMWNSGFLPSKFSGVALRAEIGRAHV